MSNVTVVPEAVVGAASDLANLGSTISEANAAAAAPTTSVAAAAQDEVSTAIAALFGGHAQQFQAFSAKAAAFHEQFVHALTGGGASYVEAEASNVLRLMVGDHARAFEVATLSNAAAAHAADFGGEILGLLGKLGFKALVTAIKKLAEVAGRQVDGAIEKARLADLAMRTKQIVTNGVKLLSKEGVEIYTDGKAIVVTGGRFPGLTEGDGLRGIVKDEQAIRDIFKLEPQTLRSLLGPELHVFARGQGLAQSYFEKVGNEIHQIDTNTQGQITRRFKTTEAIFKRWVAMTRSKVFQRL